MKCETIKLIEVSIDAIRLPFFAFPLKDRVSEWLQHEELDSFTTWEVLFQAFLNKYFPPGKTGKLMTDIISFAQLDGVFI